MNGLPEFVPIVLFSSKELAKFDNPRVGLRSRRSFISCFASTVLAQVRRPKQAAYEERVMAIASVLHNRRVENRISVFLFACGMR